MENKPARRISWIAALLATAFICFASYAAARQIMMPGGAAITQAIELPCRADQTILPYLDGVVYSDGAYLYALDGRGHQKWAYAIGAGSGFSVSEGGVAIWLGKKLTLLDGERGVPYYSASLEDNILSARVGTLYAAVQLSADPDRLSAESNSTLWVMARGGEKYENYDFTDKTVVDYGFFNNGNLFWVMALDTEGTVPMSVITTYRPGRSTTGRIAPADQVIYRTYFRNNRICAVGTRDLITYEYTGARTTGADALVYGWSLMDVSDADDPLAVFAPLAQTHVNVAAISDVRMITGSIDRTVRMPFPCFAVAAGGDRLYGASRQYVMVCGVSDTEPKAYPLPMDADRLIGITDANAAILTAGSAVYLVPLP